MKKILNSQFSILNSESGQVILILILVMTVALAIGLSVIQRSLSDVSTATKVEQSSRAFSAAEAGIENKLTGGPGSVNFSEIGATASVLGGDLIPCIPGFPGCAQGTGSRQVPLEYPPLSKEEIAQVWLADYSSLNNPPPAGYKGTSLDIYWGNSATDRAALELTLIYYEAGQYKAKKWYLDHTITRNPDNKFTQVACTGYPDTLGTNYSCKYTIGGTSDPQGPLPSSPSILMLLRARLLYNDTYQPFAVQVPSTATCGQDCSIPPQVKKIDATGTAGSVQRKVRLFQEPKVVPLYFDFGIFSVGAINK